MSAELSPAAVSRRRPSWKYTPVVACQSWPSVSDCAAGLSGSVMFHIVTIPSSEAVAIQWASGDAATDVNRTGERDSGRRTRGNAYVFQSHRYTWPSYEPERTCSPSMAAAQERTQPPCPRSDLVSWPFMTPWLTSQ